MLNLLFIAPDLPYPPKNGGIIRTYSLIAELSKRHKVTLLAFNRDPKDTTRIPALKEFCATIISVPLTKLQMPQNKREAQLLSLLSRHPYLYLSHVSSQLQHAIDIVTQQETFDIIQVEFSQMGYYSLPPTIPCVLDEHNVEYEILYRTYVNTKFSFRKLYNYFEWKKFKRNEIENCQKFDCCLTTSIRDQQILSEQLPTIPFAVIPNGVNGSYFRPGNHTLKNKYTLIFTGTIDYYPNIDGLIYFLEQIYPLIRQKIPEITFYIAGRDPPREILSYKNTPGVVITGMVDDMRVYFDMASIVIVPLRIGGGTRLKILESWAMCKPVISTSLGAEGLEYENGKNILIADKPADFAGAVIKLINDDSLYTQLASEGRRLVDDYYDWSNITRKLETTYEYVLQGFSTRLAQRESYSIA